MMCLSQFYILQQIAKACGRFSGLLVIEDFFVTVAAVSALSSGPFASFGTLRSFRSFLQRFHGKGKLAVLDRDDLDLDFLSLLKNIRGLFHSLVADLGNMDQTGHAVLKLYKCDVIHQGIDRSLQNVSDLAGLQSSLLRKFLFLSDRITR